MVWGRNGRNGAVEARALVMEKCEREKLRGESTWRTFSQNMRILPQCHWQGKWEGRGWFSRVIAKSRTRKPEFWQTVACPWESIEGAALLLERRQESSLGADGLIWGSPNVYRKRLFTLLGAHLRGVTSPEAIELMGSIFLSYPLPLAESSTEDGKPRQWLPGQLAPSPTTLHCGATALLSQTSLSPSVLTLSPRRPAWALPTPKT